MRLFVAMLITLGVASGCTNENTGDIKSATIAPGQAALDIRQFAQIKKIPDKAKQRIDSTYQSYLERSNISNYLLSNDLKEDLELRLVLVEYNNKLVIDAYFNDYLKNLVTKDKVEAFYQETKTDYSQNDYKIHSISEAVRPGISTEEEVKVHFESLLKRIKEGKSFESIAQVKNGDADSEPLPVQSLSGDNIAPELQSVLKQLEVNDVSAPVRTSSGYMLIKLIEKTVTVMPLDEVYPTVEYQLKEKLKVDEYQRLLSLSAESSP